MRRLVSLIIAAAFFFACAAISMSAEKAKGAKSMPKEKQIKLAQSAGPAHISKDATIMVFGKDGKLVEEKKGTNGFTCIPDIDDQEVPDPMCADQAAMQWGNDLMNKAPKPTNTIPGIAYMAKGGWHWEKNGKIIMNKEEPGAKRVKEPPHWMILWAFDPKASGLPTFPGKFGTYIMYEGMPFAHLMIYQDPKKIK